MQDFLALKDKTILLTGASSGIGRATAVLLADQGAHLILVGRSTEQLQKTHEMLPNAGSHYIEAYDLTQTDTIPGWMKGLATRIGEFSGVVHCAGMHHDSPLKLIRQEHFDAVIKINVAAGLMLAKGFRQRGVVSPRGGSIVLLSSVVGLVGQPGVVLYSLSKGAVIAMTKSLAVELQRDKIRVNCIAPAVVETEMTQQLFSKLPQENVDKIRSMHPLDLGVAEDVANGIAFLLSETASRWVTGTCLTVDGGYTAV